MKLVSRLVVALMAATCLWALAPVAAVAQSSPVVYPAKGQSKEQQAKDDYECHQWAVQQTGFDPTKAGAVATTPAPKQGGAVRGGAAGAAVGAGIGAAAGDAGEGAAIGGAAGAAAGAGRQRRANRQQAEAANQAQQERNAQQAGYDKAKAACLEGRGYTVK